MNRKANKVIAFYIRLSDADEDIDTDIKIESDSIVNQRKYLKDFIKNSKEFIDYTIIEFVDDGYTGTNDNRPQLQLMIEMARKKELDIIIVRDFSRFFRDYINAGYYLENELPTLGVRFISVNDNYDSNNFIGTTGGMEMVIRNIVYSAYSKDLSLKVKSVKTQMMNEGKFTGGFPPYGYIRDPNDNYKLVINYDISDNIKRIFDLALQDCSLSKIAQIFNNENIETPKIYRDKLYNVTNKKNVVSNIWTYDTIQRIIRNEMYIGNMVNGRERKDDLYSKRYKVLDRENLVIVDNTHEGIVSKKIFEDAQKIINKKSKKITYKYDMYPLRSLLRCGECNMLLWRTKRKSVSSFYVCHHCRNFNKGNDFKIMEDDLEKAVLGIITQYIQIVKNRNIETKKMTDSYTLKNEKEKEIKNLELEKFNLYEKYVNNKINKEEYLLQKQVIDKSLEEHTKELDDILAKKNTNNISDEYLKDINCNELTYNLTHSFIKKILVYDEERFEIIMKFGDIFNADTLVK